MPSGSGTQRLEPCGAVPDHDPHPSALGAGEAWCPGVPPRNPDGTPAVEHNLSAADCRVSTEQVRVGGAYCQRCAVEVPVAGELRALAEEVQAVQADVAAREAAADVVTVPEGLRAEEYAVVVSGVQCRVMRRVAADGLRLSLTGPPACWEAVIGQAFRHETTVTEAGRPAVKAVTTTARFGFNPDDADSEQIALDRAGSYCERVACALAELWREQSRIADTVAAAIDRARTVCGALPE